MKILTAETDLTSATNISKTPVVRIYNSDSSAITLTRKSNAGTTIGSYSVPSGKVIYCEKSYTDTLEGGAALKATGVGYSEELDIICLGNGGGDSIVTTNLVLHLDANNYSGSGDWLDETSNDNDGTIVGATYTNDGDADYFDLDGSNDYISLGTGSDFKQQVPITISVWLSMDNFSGNQCLYGTYQNTSTGNLYNLFRFDGSTLRFYGSKSTGFGYESFDASVGTISANTWYQFTAVIDGSMSSPTVKIYKNTTSSSHSFSQAFVPTVDLNDVDTRVGSNVYPDPLQGKIGVVMFYHKALSDSEVEQNFNALKSRYGY